MKSVIFACVVLLLSLFATAKDSIRKIEELKFYRQNSIAEVIRYYRNSDGRMIRHGTSVRYLSFATEEKDFNHGIEGKTRFRGKGTKFLAPPNINKPPFIQKIELFNKTGSKTEVIMYYKNTKGEMVRHGTAIQYLPDGTIETDYMYGELRETRMRLSAVPASKEEK